MKVESVGCWSEARVSRGHRLSTLDETIDLVAGGNLMDCFLQRLEFDRLGQMFGEAG